MDRADSFSMTTAAAAGNAKHGRKSRTRATRTARRFFKLSSSTPHGGSALPEQELLRLVVDYRLCPDLFALLVGPYYRGPGADRLEPALEIGELCQVLLLALVRH